MAKIYIDAKYRCSSEPITGGRAFEVEYFNNNSCVGMRYVPQDEHWTRKDGVVFTGEMISPIDEEE